MTAYIMTLTQAGLSAIVNVQAGTIGPVVISQIGLTDTAFTPSSTLEILPGETRRIAVSGDQLGDDLIHVQALDNSADVYGYRGFALYTSTGLLFAIYGQADSIAEKSSGTTSYIALDIAMARGQAAAITFGNTNFLNPPATTAVQGVVELATSDEAKAGADTLRALTAAAARAAVVAWLRAGADVGQLDVHTPDGYGTTGGVRLWANNPGLALIQVLSVDGLTQWGYWQHTADGVAGWNGAGGLTHNGKKVWTELNDGAGSTLDADLLDGQQGAWYADIVSRLGYVPFNSTGFTAAAIRAVLGYTPQDAAASTFGSNANGFWEKRPNGVLEQWGTITLGSGSNTVTGTVTFPIAFADTASTVVTGNVMAQPNGSWGAAGIIYAPTDASTAAYRADTANSGQSFNSGVKASWRALGRWS